MKTIPHTLLLFIALLSPLGAQPIQQIIIVGDSFSDCGNRHIKTNGTEPGEDYHYGRYSNGPVWIERLSEKLGILPPPSSLNGGTNYAYAGAETKHGIDEKTGIIHMGSQVDDFLSTYKTVPNNALVVLWGGGNDYLELTPGNIVDNLANYTTVLANAGAKEFLVVNLPPLEKGPGTKAILDRKLKNWYGQDFFTSMILFISAQYVQRQNSELASRLSQLEQDHCIIIHQLDIHKLFNILGENPEPYQIKVMDKPAYDKNTKEKAPNPNEHAFYDHIHPSAKMHDFLAEQALYVIQKPVYLLQTLNDSAKNLIQVKLENPGNPVQDYLLHCPLQASKYLGYARKDSTILIKNNNKILAQIPLNDIPSNHFFERQLDDNTFFFEAQVTIADPVKNPHILVKLNVTDTLNPPEFACFNTSALRTPGEQPKVYATRRTVASNGNDFELLMPGQNTTERIRGTNDHSCYDVLGNCTSSNSIIIRSDGSPITQYPLDNDVCHKHYYTREDTDYTLYTEIHHDPDLGNYYVHLEVDSSEGL